MLKLCLLPVSYLYHNTVLLNHHIVIYLDQFIDVPFDLSVELNKEDCNIVVKSCSSDVPIGTFLNLLQ